MKEDDHYKWDLLALTLGYNELSKFVQTLGEKVFCRLARDAAQREYECLGGKINRTTEETVICVLRESLPQASFTIKDIALMRREIEKYDELHKNDKKVDDRGIPLCSYDGCKGCPNCW